MRRETKQEEKKNEEYLSEKKNLEKHFEILQKDVERIFILIKSIRDEKEKQIEIAKEVAAEKKLDYDMIIAELQRVMYKYKMLETGIEVIQKELKSFIEESHEELLEIQKKRTQLMKQQETMRTEKEEEYKKTITAMKESLERFKFITEGIALKSCDTFIETQFADYEECIGNSDIAPLLEKIHETMYKKGN